MHSLRSLTQVSKQAIKGDVALFHCATIAHGNNCDHLDSAQVAVGMPLDALQLAAFVAGGQNPDVVDGCDAKAGHESAIAIGKSSMSTLSSRVPKRTKAMHDMNLKIQARQARQGSDPLMRAIAVCLLLLGHAAEHAAVDVKMQLSRFQTIRSRFSPSNIRTSLRRSSSASTATSTSSASSATMSPVHTINSVLFRQPSILDMEEEKRRSGTELTVLEPRPIVYWGGLEERMGSLNSL
ncbi:hypothetical protein F4808DRAFT_456493 [Astrocystis sublimbata]|nr:hypothetical protein F4808DRAFT_456493 [Astrocystis sublimbata]